MEMENSNIMDHNKEKTGRGRVTNRNIVRDWIAGGFLYMAF